MPTSVCCSKYSSRYQTHNLYRLFNVDSFTRGRHKTALPMSEHGAGQMCHLNWNITWAVALEVTNINFLIAHFATIYENIISLHVSLIFGTVCQTVLWMLVL